jgi:hypothetical protein
MRQANRYRLPGEPARCNLSGESAVEGLLEAFIVNFRGRH